MQGCVLLPLHWALSLQHSPATCPLIPSTRSVSHRLTHSQLQTDHLSTSKIASAHQLGVDLWKTEREIVSSSGQSSHGHSCPEGICP